MHPSTAISASPAVAPSPPRAQRPHSRKSGLTAALQKQQQQQNQSQPRSNNTSNNGSRQAHARHQSMPPQQRGHANNHTSAPSTKTDMTNVTILKRSSAAPASPTKSAVDSPKADATVPQPQHPQPQQHRNQKHQQRPQVHHSQQNQQPSKARRVQRRKEIEVTTESLAQVDLDLALHSSPPLDPSSPPSSSDSDDSESAMARLPDNYLATKRSRQLTSSPLQRPNSAPAVSQPRRGGPQNMEPAMTNPQQGNAVTSRASHPMDIMMRPTSAMTIKSASADKVMLADRAPSEKKSTLYAGPTFHNSPAPTSLPIPAFARSAGNSPSEPTLEKLPSAPFFGEAASPQLNSMRPQLAASSAPAWPGHYSMPMGQTYNVPERMATSSFTPQASGQYGVDQLMEISQSLRTLLKIQSQ
ncbi:hypothetical protein BGZ99_005593 [Dissophora globulifera]|uniref:Uncharacterized protein n=1 Tax=Dissophora globulifera TaxID=979702 RepID=A0A9P6RH62_9FUNG|nr:hypothetical protein BGZ99_005593 [Dissophora globulifera]